MKLLVFNDPHISPTPPASRKANYTQCILDKLTEIVNFANLNNVDVLACTGDWVISKKPEKTPYWLAAAVQDILTNFKGNIVTAIGNHDTVSTIEFFSHSPLFMICHAANIVYNPASGVVCFDYEQGTSVVAVNYDLGATAQGICHVASQSFTPDTKCRILLVHGPIVRPEAAELYPPQFLVKAIDPNDLVGCADYIFYGDIHDPHGQYKLGVTTFCNYGAIARNSAHELNNIRPVQCAYFDTDTGIIQPLELENVLPATDVFRIEELQRDKQVNREVEAFVDSLSPEALSFTVLSPEVLLTRVANADYLNRIEKEIAVKAIEGAC